MKAPATLDEFYRTFSTVPALLGGSASSALARRVSYRFDRRWREGEFFGFVLRRVARGQPLPYRRLVVGGTA